MRGRGQSARSLFSYVSLEERVPQWHPLRRVRAIVDEALASLSPRFEALYSKRGRPSVPPEHLLRALLLQVLYGVRSERQLMERLEFDMLFRWFVGVELDERVWDATTFTKNRDRLLDGDVATGFFEAVLERARRQGLLSRDHFTVDGTLIEAWASHQSFRPKDDSDADGGTSFRGKKRKNETHESTTDPECRLMRKGRGKEARLAYQGNVLVENRSGLVVGAEVAIGDGPAETEGELCPAHLLTAFHAHPGTDKPKEPGNSPETAVTSILQQAPRGRACASATEAERRRGVAAVGLTLVGGLRRRAEPSDREASEESRDG